MIYIDNQTSDRARRDKLEVVYNDFHHKSMEANPDIYYSADRVNILQAITYSAISMFLIFDV
jgi:hypothetical protein